ncbi:hypothetical protein INT47_005725 [Mucor saturninus]|uniref:Glutathione peroxidase n=1 Tax=Mucor saturninus TaxID=64648 RepID=A0A8H7QEV7_9FUNG|nr:hypothetical protein INT47_005725 [Mucor saturninus]
MTTLYDFTIKNIENEEYDLSGLRGVVVLIVNIVSKPGVYDQELGSLEVLYEYYQNKNFVVIGVPCNQFGGQETFTAEEIVRNCNDHHKLTFPLTAKLEVNGENEHPMFKWLKECSPGILGAKKIEGNMEKFLINAEGQLIGRYHFLTPLEYLYQDLDNIL